MQSDNQKIDKKGAGTIILMAAIILVAKFMGLLRETMVAGIYGQGMESDILNISTQIPLLFFDMVLGVAILSTFVPIFNKYLKEKGETEAMAFANNFLSIVTLIATIAAIIGIIFAEPLIRLMAPGFADIPGKIEATTSLLRILFPSIVFTSAAYISVGILQSYGHFTIPSLISVVSNGVMILYLAIMGNRLGLMGTAVSMLIAWALQLIVQIPQLKTTGFKLKPSFNFKDAGLKEAALLAIPVLISSWVQPLCNVINMSFGSRMGDGAVSALNWGNKIYIIMVGVFAYAITNFIFPKLSRMSDEDGTDGFIEMTRQSLGWIIFIITLVAAMFIALSEPIIRIVFERGAFTAENTAVTSSVLFCYSFGMVGYAVCEVLNKSFYAIRDGKTPMAASILGIVVNFLSAFLLVRIFDLEIKGLALAGAISSIAIALCLLVMINKKRKGIIDIKFILNFIKIIVCGIVAYVIAALLYRYTDGLGSGFVMTIVRLCVAGIPSAIIYLVLSFILKVDELKFLKK